MYAPRCARCPRRAAPRRGALRAGTLPLQRCSSACACTPAPRRPAPAAHQRVHGSLRAAVRALSWACSAAARRAARLNAAGAAPVASTCCSAGRSTANGWRASARARQPARRRARAVLGTQRRGAARCAPERSRRGAGGQHLLQRRALDSQRLARLSTCTAACAPPCARCPGHAAPRRGALRA